MTNPNHVEIYDPVSQNWSTTGNTPPVGLVGCNEIGPAVLRPDGTIFATGATSNTQTITLSDKTQLGYVNNGGSYLLCGNNVGGSGKWYVYDSASGGSVKASTATSLSLTTCS